MYVSWRVSVRPPGAGLGNMFGQECTFSYMYTCIGYKLPTFGEYMLIGGFLCALRAQGWGICLVNRQVPGGQFPPGQVPDWTTSPWTSSMARKLSRGKLSASRLPLVAESMDYIGWVGCMPQRRGRSRSS